MAAAIPTNEYFTQPTDFEDFTAYRNWHHPRLFPHRAPPSLLKPSRNPQQLNTNKRDFHRVASEWQHSAERKKILTALDRHQLALTAIQDVTCIGLGSFSELDGEGIDKRIYHEAMLRHAKAIDLALLAKRTHHFFDIFWRYRFRVRVCDLGYLDEDREFLEELGVEVLDAREMLPEFNGKNIMLYEHVVSGKIPGLALGNAPILVTARGESREEEGQYKGGDWRELHVEVFRIDEDERSSSEQRLSAHALGGTRGYVRKELAA